MAECKTLTHLHRNYFGSPVHVRCSESEQAKAGADEAVLAAVVIHQPIAMVGAVVFDCKTLKSIKQVWTAQETASLVVD